MSLALKDIRRNPFRFTAAIAGCGLLVLGALGMLGLYRGIVADALTIIDRIGADAWVVQAGTLGPFGETSRVADDLDLRVSALPEVAAVRRFTQISRLIPRQPRPTRVILVGLDYPIDRGGWVPLVTGRTLRNAHYEVIADENARLKLGEVIRLGRDDYHVVGIARGLVDLGGDPVLLVTLPDALGIDATRASEAVLLGRARGDAPAASTPDGGPAEIGAVLVQLKPGRSLQDLERSVAAWGDARVLSADEQRQLVLEVRIQKLRLQIFFFVWLILLIVGVIVGMTTYTLTVERLREISIIRILGADNIYVARYISEQALLIGLGSCVAANVGGLWLFPHFPRNVVILPWDRVGLSSLVLVICIIGSVFAVRRALRANPQEVLA